MACAPLFQLSCPRRQSWIVFGWHCPVSQAAKATGSAATTRLKSYPLETAPCHTANGLPKKRRKEKEKGKLMQAVKILLAFVKEKRIPRTKMNNLNGMHNEVFKQKMLSASKIPMQEFLGDVRHRQQKVWREADALSPQEVNRKAVTFHHWCGKPLNQTERTPFCIPSYLSKDLEECE
eukprot:1160454-Pelagomonas_calceolata.AAC.1